MVIHPHLVLVGGGGPSPPPPLSGYYIEKGQSHDDGVIPEVT